MKKLVVASGYFDPLHVGHIEYLEMAKRLGHLIVVVNNDDQIRLKKGKPFMKAEDRVTIISALACVDEVVLSMDKGKSISRTLEMINPDIFAKGGDRFASEIPEAAICKKLKIKMVDGLGDKIRSSSEICKK